MQRRPAAFTLIELLVVISIIALLIGILLPALGAARDTAKNVQCLSTVRQVATAMLTYEVDNGRLPLSIGEYFTTTTGRWNNQVSQVDANPPYRDVRILYEPYLGDADFFSCPVIGRVNLSLQAHPVGTARIYGGYMMIPGYYADHNTGEAWPDRRVDDSGRWIRTADKWLYDGAENTVLLGDMFYRSGDQSRLNHPGGLPNVEETLKEPVAGSFGGAYYTARSVDDARLQTSANFGKKDGSAASWTGDDPKMHNLEVVSDPSSTYRMPLEKILP